MTDDFSCDVEVNIISRQHQAVSFTSDSLRGEPGVNDKQGSELHKQVWLKQGSLTLSVEDLTQAQPKHDQIQDDGVECLSLIPNISAMLNN
jgi:hypothetical protein